MIGFIRRHLENEFVVHSQEHEAAVAAVQHAEPVAPGLDLEIGPALAVDDDRVAQEAVPHVPGPGVDQLTVRVEGTILDDATGLPVADAVVRLRMMASGAVPRTLTTEEVGGLSGRNVVVAIGPVASGDAADPTLAGPALTPDPASDGESRPADEQASVGAEQLLGPTEIPTDLVEPDLVVSPDLAPSPRPCD